MKTLLIIFSYKYPYEPPTEQFLHIELPYLQLENTEITLVPYAREINDVQTYHTPIAHNTEVFKRSKFTDILYGLLGVVRGFTNLLKEYVEICSSVSNGRKAKAVYVALKQYMQAQTLCSRLKKHFDSNELKKYEKVILYSYWLNPMSLAAAEYKHYLNKKGLDNVQAIARAHGQGDLYIEGIIDKYRPFSNILSNQLDCIYSISEQGAQYLNERKLQNTVISRIGIENSNTINLQNIHHNIPIVVSCSVVNSNKRVGEIAKAVSKLNFTKIQWIHFGGGDDFDEVYHWCAENMPDNIEWNLRGWTSNQDIHKFYIESMPDVFINLSKIEGIPVSIMEAMSYGIPCVATDVGATSEIVVDSKNGYILSDNFNCTDAASALTKIILQTSTDKVLMRQNAYDTWKNLYDAKKNFTVFAHKINHNKFEGKINSMKINFAVLGRQYEKYQTEYEDAALRTLRSGWYIMGKELEAFEKAYAQFQGSKYCIGVGNGLDALRLALTALGIGHGDEVIVQTNTFIATALAVTENGATPVFVEADEFFGIDVSSIEKSITEKTKAIIAVHLYGQPCDMDPILSIAKKHNLYVVEDCAQCHGATYKGKKCGTFGDVACFSFYPMKPIGAFGDSGAIVTNNDELYNKLCMLRNYGSKIKYKHEIVGINSRMDEIQAAITSVNLKHADENNAERMAIAQKYIKGITNPKIRIPASRPDTIHVYHVFPIFCENRENLKQYLENNGISTQIHYPICCHLAECYSELGYKLGDLPKTEKYAACELSLPIYVGLSDNEIQHIIDTLNAY